MTDRDSIGDSTGPTARAKRKIPAVTEVVEEIGRRRAVSASERPAVFQAAQHVCTDEIRLVRTGFAPSTVVELADRAESIMGRRDPGQKPAARWSENEPFGDLTVASGALKRRPELADELWPSKPDNPRPIQLPAAEAVPDDEPDRTPAPTPVPARPEKPIVTGPTHGSRMPLFLLSLLVVGAAAGYFVWTGRRTRTFHAAATAARPVATTSAARIPGPAVPAPAAATPAAAPTSKPVKTKIPGETAPASQSRAGTMRSSDWIGAPAFVLHCSSYKKRENAERDAARLSKIYGQPSHVLGVDLGGEGNWFRVVLGEFANADDAFAFRSKLLSEKAPEVGLIYEVLPAAAPR